MEGVHESGVQAGLICVEALAECRIRELAQHAQVRSHGDLELRAAGNAGAAARLIDERALFHGAVLLLPSLLDLVSVQDL